MKPESSPTANRFHTATHPPPRTAINLLEQYLGWLPEVPFLAVRTTIGDLLTEQRASTELEWAEAHGRPGLRTVGRPVDTNPPTLIMTRAGLCIEFALGLRSATGERAVLVGCFTWAASGLEPEGQRHDQVWLDLWTPLDRASNPLESRLMSVGRSIVHALGGA